MNRMLIFDDCEEFARSITMKLWVKTGFEARIETNWQNLDQNFKLNDSWDIIVTDVDVPGSPYDGHDLIKRRIEERKLNVPVIVMSGAYGVELGELQKKYASFFSAYISKNDKDFSSKLQTAVDKALAKNPLPRLGVIFDDLGKLDEVVAEDTTPKTLHDLGLLDLSETMTIAELIKEGEKMNDKSALTEYLWGKAEDFRKPRRR